DTLIIELKRNYQFLSDENASSVLNFFLREKKLPMLYIIRQYIATCTSPAASISKDFYGLNKMHRRLTIEKIALLNGISGERVRQICAAEFPIKHPLLKEYIRKTLMPSLGSVIMPSNGYWEQLQNENMLNEPVSDTCLLVAALVDSHAPLKIADDADTVLIERSILRNFKPRGVLKAILRKVLHPSKQSVEIDIRPFLYSCVGSKSSSCYDGLLQVYTDYLCRNYNCTSPAPGLICTSPNRVDVALEAEKILAEHGSPMQIEELWKTFNEKFPASAIPKMQYFKTFLWKSDNIKPKGNTGIYSLTCWTDQYLGTITEYIRDIVSSSAELIPMSQIVEHVQQQFPDSSRNRVYSLMLLDKKCKYIFYEDDLVGLPTHTATAELRLKRLHGEYDFNARLDELKNFVEANRRMPFVGYVASKADTSLARWLYNIFNRKISSTPEQMQALHDFINEHKEIPQNGNEYRFLLKCREILQIAEKTKSLPRPSMHPNLYQWYILQCRNNLKYTDNRRIYFENLQKDLVPLLNKNVDRNWSTETPESSDRTNPNTYFTPSLFTEEV
ncbi:MAG: hypothetical protein NC548_64860, partial [Lachnospiraceae bacterium]|nr:hypothetical protein [Lachnospiraceae bacterium]